MNNLIQYLSPEPDGPLSALDIKSLPMKKRMEMFDHQMLENHGLATNVSARLGSVIVTKTGQGRCMVGSIFQQGRKNNYVAKKTITITCSPPFDKNGIKISFPATVDVGKIKAALRKVGVQLRQKSKSMTKDEAMAEVLSNLQSIEIQGELIQAGCPVMSADDMTETNWDAVCSLVGKVLCIYL